MHKMKYKLDIQNLALNLNCRTVNFINFWSITRLPSIFSYRNRRDDNRLKNTITKGTVKSKAKKRKWKKKRSNTWTKRKNKSKTWRKWKKPYHDRPKTRKYKPRPKTRYMGCPKFRQNSTSSNITAECLSTALKYQSLVSGKIPNQVRAEARCVVNKIISF